MLDAAEEWVVYRMDDWVECEPRADWDRWVKKFPNYDEEGQVVFLLATGLTEAQAEAMTNLTRG